MQAIIRLKKQNKFIRWQKHKKWPNQEFGKLFKKANPLASSETPIDPKDKSKGWSQNSFPSEDKPIHNIQPS